MTIKELLEKRAQLFAEARKILDTADSEKRSLTDEERGKSDKLIDEARKLKEQAETLAADERRAREIADAQKELEESRGRQTRQTNPGEGSAEKRTIEIRSGQTITLGSRDTNEYRDAFRTMLANGGEHRALSQGTGSAGGYLSPEEFVAKLIMGLDNALFVRQLATVMTVNDAGSLGVPSLDADPADADWTTELGTGSEDSSTAFGKREFIPHPLAKRVKISKKLLRSSAIPVEELVRNRLAYKFSVTQEKAFMTGNGSGQPLGLFTASTNGITTGRDVSTDNTTTAFTFNGLKNAKYSVKAQYRKKAAWIFHRDGVKLASKITDENGQYIWQPSVTMDEPDRLMGSPVYESEYAPNTFTASNYVGVYGDLTYYWIADALSMTVQVLTELYAETNQNGYIGRLECDGMPVLAEAFSRVKLAAG